MNRFDSISEENETLAALYAAGALDSRDRGRAERLLTENPAFADLVAELQDAICQSVAASSDIIHPPTSLKQQIMESVEQVPVEILKAFNLKQHEGFVLADTEGRIRWVNSNFMEMCGYSLEELRGRKPGHLLQGPATDPTAAEEMRSAVRECRPTRVEMVNYHKNGSPYWVAIQMSPVMGENERPTGFVAVEQELHDRDLPVMLA